ncbi:MAG TPA: hypothetical protein VFY76_03440, partial [Nocardioides sp.]|nr:hypothetical protein [Nocardioides sp.]
MAVIVRAVATLTLVAGSLLFTTASPAAAESCIRAGLQGANAQCQWTYADYSTTSASSGDGHTWVVSIQCANGGICNDNVECVEGGQAGYIHD